MTFNDTVVEKPTTPRTSLPTVCVWTGVCHGEHARSAVLVIEVFVLEFSAIDALAARSIAGREIAALNHEITNDTMKAATLVVQRHSGFL